MTIKSPTGKLQTVLVAIKEINIQPSMAKILQLFKSKQLANLLDQQQQLQLPHRQHVKVASQLVRLQLHQLIHQLQQQLRQRNVEHLVQLIQTVQYQ